MIRRNLSSTSRVPQCCMAAFWLISSWLVATPPAFAAFPGPYPTPDSRINSIASGVHGMLAPSQINVQPLASRARASSALSSFCVAQGNAASQGTVEAYQAVSIFWVAKEPAAAWFGTVPFGLNAEGMAGWYLHGDGLKLWEETYAPFNLVPRPGISTGPQMAGWFRKKINTIADFKGLKMRIPGLGGQVVTKAGGTAVLMPGGEVYGALGLDDTELDALRRDGVV